ncbi:MAG: DUF1080 domain-containing protein [Gemmataceae bacterium]
MRTSLFALPLLLAALAAPARADDFLSPGNWEGLPELWKLEGSTVTGKSPEGGLKHNTFLCSKKPYKDFEMNFKIKLEGGNDANSGIQIRSQVVDKDKFIVAGPQCDIGAGYWGSLYGEKFDKEGKVGGGHIMKLADAKKVNEVLKKDDFNDYRIKCVGKHLTVSINGVTTVDDDFPIMPEEGIIAYQLHVTKTPMTVTFKDIEFKELK